MAIVGREFGQLLTRALLALSLAFSWLASASIAHASECPRITAPAPFRMVTGKTTAGRPINDGIVPLGFVDLRGKETAHGIDVSKYQEDADFQSVAHCGGKFAYVRLSGGAFADNELLYRTHWANARAAGLVPGPYHNLSIVPVQANVADLLLLAAASARRQAEIFVSRLDEVIKLDPTKSNGSVVRLPIALDLSAKPPSTLSSAEKDKFAAVYVKEVCTFLQEIKISKYKSDPVILFIDPYDYRDYHLATIGCGAADNLIWLRFRPTDGNAFYETLPSNLIREVCNSSRPRSTTLAPLIHGKCVLEQYTSFGGFALFKPGAPLDLDRFLDASTFVALAVPEK